MTPFVRAAALKNYVEVAGRHDLDPGRMLRDVGLERSMLTDPDNRLPSAAVATLLEQSAIAADCPTFGLRMAEARQLSDFGAVSLLLSHQPTLRHALRALIEFRHLINESLALEIEDAGDLVVLREGIVVDGPDHPTQATDLAVGVLFRLCENLLERHWKPTSVNFTYAAPADLTTHRRMFGTRYGCRVHFDSDFNGILCNASVLDRSIPSADPEMARYSRRFVETLPSADHGSDLLDIHKAIYLFLPMGHATIERVADGLGTTVRTLQRRLEHNGTTFRHVLHDVRRNLAVRYVQNPEIPMTRIADLLGYSTPASFTRWFTSQFGIPPSDWREQQQSTATGPITTHAGASTRPGPLVPGRRIRGDATINAWIASSASHL